MYDIIIVGCGPAGMTSAIYAARANKKVLILEKETIGGQMSSAPLIENYPGFVSISGSELATNMFDQIMELGVDFELEEVKEIIDGDIKKIVTDNNTYIFFHHACLGCARKFGAFYGDRDDPILLDFAAEWAVRSAASSCGL